MIGGRLLDEAAAGEAIRRRASCRAYDLSRPLDGGELARLREAVDAVNGEAAGLHIQLVGPCEGEDALRLDGSLFRNAPASYLALAAMDSPRMQEQVGYQGERLVLLATSLGLGTCWIAGSYDEASVRCALGDGERLHAVIPVGHAMRVQPMRQRSIRRNLRKQNRYLGDLYDGPKRLNQAPLWIQAGVGAVWAGPSALNEQAIVIRQAIKDAPPSASVDQERARCGLAMIDLGIAKLHFEIGAASEGVHGSWQWGDGGSFLPE